MLVNTAKALRVIGAYIYSNCILFASCSEAMGNKQFHIRKVSCGWLLPVSIRYAFVSILTVNVFWIVLSNLAVT